MITNQKLKKALDEIKSITSYDVILYSSKGKHLTGTVEEPAHSDLFVKEFIVAGEEFKAESDFIAFEVEVESELEYVLLIQYLYYLFLFSTRSHLSYSSAHFCQFHSSD